MAPFALGAQIPATAARPVPTSLPIDRVVAVKLIRPDLRGEQVTALLERTADAGAAASD